MSAGAVSWGDNSVAGRGAFHDIDG